MTVYRSILAVVFSLFISLIQQSHGVQLKIATLSPEGSTWMKKMRDGAEEIALRTDGRVTFKFYPGGVMGQDKAVLRKISVGQLHGGAFVNGSLNKIYPGVQVYNLIMKFNSYDEVDYVRRKMDGAIKQGLENNGFIVLGLSEIGFAYVMSTEPIANVADMRRQKVWVPENNYVATQALEALSVAPIPLPLRDVLIALQTGMVNTVAGSAIGALTLQWHTKVNYLTELPFSYIYGIFVLSERAFKNISPADQNIVRDIMGSVLGELDKLSRADNISALNAIRDQGIQFIKPNAQSIDEIKSLIASANENLMTAGNMDKAIAQSMDKHLMDFRSKSASSVK